MPTIAPSLDLSLADAAINCAKDGATAVVTLRSGVQFEGKLERSEGADMGTAHMKTDHGGWVTIDKEEIAAVEARREPHF